MFHSPASSWSLPVPSPTAAGPPPASPGLQTVETGAPGGGRTGPGNPGDAAPWLAHPCLCRSLPFAPNHCAAALSSWPALSCMVITSQSSLELLCYPVAFKWLQVYIPATLLFLYLHMPQLTLTLTPTLTLTLTNPYLHMPLNCFSPIWKTDCWRRRSAVAARSSLLTIASISSPILLSRSATWRH